MKQSDNLAKNRRKYIRLNSVFPVQFRMLKVPNGEFVCDWMQGFTANVAKGGICLVGNNIPEPLLLMLKNKEVKLSLLIDMPVSSQPISALGIPSWVTQDNKTPDKHIIGVEYEKIDAKSNSRIILYAHIKRLLPLVALTAFLFLGLVLWGNHRENITLSSENVILTSQKNVLIEQLNQIRRDYLSARKDLKEIESGREKLQDQIKGLQLRFQVLQNEKAKNRQKAKKIAELNTQIDLLIKDKDRLRAQLDSLGQAQQSLNEELSRLGNEKAELQKSNFAGVYRWITAHQNPRTGLVLSFEGDNDIRDWAFIYDQSLAGQVYMLGNDFGRVRKMLDFFKNKAQRSQGWFFNAYYFDDGSPAECIVHTGPNIWIGILAMQYTKKSGDNSYLVLAQDIADKIIAFQKQDSDGGLRGGPQVSWYSTEHNLDAYAFLNMLYSLTNNKDYSQSRDKIMSWIEKHTYDKADVPVKRGKGDSTIATDTYAWSIAAIGPEKLLELSMSPDKIINFAQDNMAVEVLYKRPDGIQVKIKGFDFAPQRHLARGQVVSAEWTAQMVISYQIMADFWEHKQNQSKAKSYQTLADDYLDSLGSMIITSPSASGQGDFCLPYATEEFVDTGHGWSTPKGSSTGSLSASAYAFFAYRRYNPLAFKEE